MHSAKVCSIEEAVSIIHDGDIVITTGFAIWRKPMAIIYEMVRKQKKQLHIFSNNGGLDVDMLIGAGCVSVFEGNYCGFEVYGKIGNNFARAVKENTLVFEEYSHYHNVLRLEAGATGMPFISTISSLGTDLLNPQYDMMKKAGLRSGCNPYIPKNKLIIMQDPFSDEPTDTVVLPPLKANVAIAHVQQIGEKGTIRIAGQKFADIAALKAADKVIVVAEEIVPEEYLRQEPDNNNLSGIYVDAIIECPFGAHPSGVHKFYDTDKAFITNYALNGSKTQDDFNRWADEWIYSIPNRKAYLNKLSADQLVELRANSVLRFSTLIKRGNR